MNLFLPSGKDMMSSFWFNLVFVADSHIAGNYKCLGHVCLQRRSASWNLLLFTLVSMLTDQCIKRHIIEVWNVTDIFLHGAEVLRKNRNSSVESHVKQHYSSHCRICHNHLSHSECRKKNHYLKHCLLQSLKACSGRATVLQQQCYLCGHCMCKLQKFSNIAIMYRQTQAVCLRLKSSLLFQVLNTLSLLSNTYFLQLTDFLTHCSL